MVVVDASVGVPLLAGGPGTAALWEQMSDLSESWHAPELFDLEVLQTLRRYETLALLSRERVQLAVAAMHGLQMTRYRHGALLARAWELRHTVSAYDGAYCALAEALDAPLVTLDAGLARSGAGRVRFELLRAG